MPDPVNLSYAIGLKPKDAIAYFEGKGYTIGFRWHDVAQEAHARAFTVAGVMKVDVLEDIKSAMLKAFTDGHTQADFEKNLKPILQAKGWWGRGYITDKSTGEITGKYLDPWRLKTIYRTNMQTALMAGRYKAFMANVDDRPFWQYVAVMDRRTRPSHAALNGRVFRYDDPFWISFWPPNGWNCRCSVRALDADNLQERGIDLSSSAGRLDEIEVPNNRRNPAAGMARVARFEYTPGKFITPDAGWSYNPGKSRALWDANATRGDIKQVGRIKTWSDYGRPDIRTVPGADKLPTPAMLPRADTRAEAKEQLAAALGVSAENPLRSIETPVGHEVVDYAWLYHMVEKSDAARERYANFILPTLTQPYEVWMSEYEDGLRRRYIGLFKEAGMLAIVRVNLDGSLLWNVMKAKNAYLNSQRDGVLIYHK